jgi:uncharacterized LabA/DUF88 family protein
VIKIKNAIVYVDFENIVKHLKKYDKTPSSINFFKTIMTKLKEIDYRILDVNVYGNFDDLDLKGNNSQTHIQSIGFSTHHVFNNGKNSSDIQIVVDVLEDVYRNKDLEMVVLISNDKDFIPLVKKIKREAKKICLINFNIGKAKVMSELPDNHLFMEDIFELKDMELIVSDVEDDLLSLDVRMEDIDPKQKQKAKELSKYLYESKFWREYLQNNIKVGLNGYVDIVNRNIWRQIDKEDIMNLFKIAYCLEYVMIWKDTDGMYYIDEGKNKNMVYSK